jgi:hypothetical protein
MTTAFAGWLAAWGEEKEKREEKKRNEEVKEVKHGTSVYIVVDGTAIRMRMI